MELSTRDERMDWMIQWCQFDENEIDSLEHYIQHYDDYILHEDLCPSFLIFRLHTILLSHFVSHQHI